MKKLALSLALALAGIFALPVSAQVVRPQNGGTGIANNVAATLTRSGNHAVTLTTTGTTSVTLPTSGTLCGSATDCNISVNDANNALSVTQAGAGNVALFEDVASDTSPTIVDALGNVVIGHTAALSSFSGGVFTPRTQHVGINQAGSSIGLANFNSSASSPTIITASKSKGTTVGAYDAVGSDDDLFRLSAQGSDGTDFAIAADILFGVDGTVGANQVPGDIALRTATSTGAITIALRVDSRQHVLLKGGTPVIGACGTSPSVAGADQAMLVTVGTGGAASSCAVTFGTAWVTAPVCTAQNDTDRVAYSMVTTTTGLTITASAAFTASSKFHIICMGY